MQTDLDAFLVQYNTKRPHQGLNMHGRTPFQVFVEGLPPADQPLAQEVDESPQAA